MKIVFDEHKRNETLAVRGLDFNDAPQVFLSEMFQMHDNRVDYGEQRFISVGILNERTVVVVWTKRGNTRRIISMRHAHDKETRRYTQKLD